MITGHIIQYIVSPDNFDNNFLFRIIYSFHMPLFMCISGYVARYNKSKTIKKLCRRVVSLLLPFLTFAIINCIIYRQSIIRTFIYQENALWFFWTLSAIEILIYLADTITNKFNGGSVYYLLINLILLCIPDGLFGLGLVKIYYTWYIVGYILPDYLKKQNVWGRLLCIVGWPITVLFWMRNADPLFMKMFDISSNSVAKIVSLFCIIYRVYIVPFFGIGFVYNLWNLLWNKLEKSCDSLIYRSAHKGNICDSFLLHKKFH